MSHAARPARGVGQPLGPVPRAVVLGDRLHAVALGAALDLRVLLEADGHLPGHA
jgi:hypothetical protein